MIKQTRKIRHSSERENSIWKVAKASVCCCLREKGVIPFPQGFGSLCGEVRCETKEVRLSLQRERRSSEV